MKYVIDIDGTICTITNGYYENAEPLWDRIEHINKLYDKGNTIVYFTARGMNTYSDNVILAKDKWFDFTKNQLQKWNAKYHDLILGKPSGDLYIDDKGMRANDFFLRIYEQFKL
jgi:capsule biosynthesis phosphatase